MASSPRGRSTTAGDWITSPITNMKQRELTENGTRLGTLKACPPPPLTYFLYLC